MNRLPMSAQVSAVLLAACVTSSALAQGGATCVEAAPAILGENAYDNSGAFDTPDYTGLCDMGFFGTDSNHNAVWFRWTATATDTFTVSTCNTAGGVDTRLSVQTACDPSSVVACDDDGPNCAGFSSLLEFPAVAGQEYYIAVGVFSAATPGGPGIMSITQGGGGASGCGQGGSCCEPGFGPGCKDPECCSAVCAEDVFCCDVEWDDLCAEQARVICESCAVECPLPPFTAEEQEPCGEDINGGCSGGGVDVVGALPASVKGTFWLDLQAQVRDTDWFEVTVAQSSEISISLHSAAPCFAGLFDPNTCTVVGEFSEGVCPSTTSVCVVPGTYWIVVVPDVVAEFLCGSGVINEYVVEISSTPCDAVPPPNDSCDEATVANLGSNPFDNTFAASDVTDPSCGFDSAAFLKDVFFTFTAPAAATYTFETCSGPAPFDTGIEVWSDCPKVGGVLLACNDDGGAGCASFSSSVNYSMQANEQVLIRIGGWDGETGATDLTIIEAPPGPGNDLCEDAIVVQVGSTPYTTASATDDGLTPSPCDNISFRNDIWFEFTAPASLRYLVSLCGSTGDTRLEVSTGCGETAFACNDDRCGAQSELSFDATAGVTYTIRVGTWSATGVATGDLTISEAPAGPPNDACASATVVQVGSTPYTTAGATTDGPTPSPCDTTSFQNDLWYRFTAPSTETYRVSLCGSTGDTRLEVSTGCGETATACNDDFCGLQSEVTFPATQGTAYTIRVGTFGAAGTASGNLVISAAGGGGGGGGGEGLTCATAIEFPSEGGSVPFSRAGATVDLDLTGLCDPGTFGNDTVWNVVFYRWNPAQSGSYELTTCNQASHDTRLAVLTTCEVTSVVACNDDGTDCAGFTSQLFFDAECGTEYILAVGGYSSTTTLGTGTLGLNLQSSTGTCSGGSQGDLDGDGDVDGFDLTVLLSAWGPCSGCQADIDGNGVVDGFDLTALLSGWTG